MTSLPNLPGPLRLQPLYMERVWGGRALETVFSRELPDADAPYGESWEVVDRPDERSVVFGGPLSGLTLSELWTHHRPEIFGRHAPAAPRFPLLIKILDARDTLSLQVHPPALIAGALGGEPKTEMWVVVDAEPGASLYAGVNEGVTRETFDASLRAGTAAGDVPKIPAAPGDFIFIPSGRLHAIGAGLLIFEIQQNSDTTYRVFDWNRTGLDGKPRALHIAESLQCIDFSDTTPGMGHADGETLVKCEHFHVRRHTLAPGETTAAGDGRFRIFGVVSGTLTSADDQIFRPGDWPLLPACLETAARTLTAGEDGVVFLEVGFGRD